MMNCTPSHNLSQLKKVNRLKQLLRFGEILVREHELLTFTQMHWLGAYPGVGTRTSTMPGRSHSAAIFLRSEQQTGM